MPLRELDGRRPRRPRAGSRGRRLREDRSGQPGIVTPAGEQAFFAPLFELLKANNDKDPYLRHAAVMGLVHAVHNPVDLWNAWKLAKNKYDLASVRMGVLLALSASSKATRSRSSSPMMSRESSLRPRGPSTTSE